MKEADKNNQNNKIRILFLSANPRSTKKLDLDKEYNAIDDAIESAGRADQFLLKPKPETSVSRLQEFLIKYKPEIVHFAGHGDDSLETGIFLFQDSRGKKEPASKEDIAELFRILNEHKTITKKDKIRLVVLNACFSKELADEIAKHVDCVIGMHNQVDDTAARKFAESFYFGITSQYSVQAALDLARNQLTLLSIPKDHMIPGIAIRESADPKKMTFVVSDENRDSRKSNPESTAKSKQKFKKARNATGVDAESISKGTIDANQEIEEVTDTATGVKIGRIGD
jgi:CHAT domain-containing protein